MPHRKPLPYMAFVLFVLWTLSALAADKASVQGTFKVGGIDAGLTNVRAQRVTLDEQGTQGIGVLLTARPSTGDIEDWRTANPSKSGNFLYVIFDEKNEVWVVELGHRAAKSGRFGVVNEVRKVAFELKGDRLKGHIRTPREESFGEDLFTVDLTFDAPVERNPTVK